MCFVVQASLWCTESFNLKSTLEEHTRWITDVRFCPSMLCVATSSADKTVRVWDADNVSQDFHESNSKIKINLNLNEEVEKLMGFFFMM